MLTTLRLRNFRCYTTLNWEIPAEGVLLIGSNAQGKTSLLEAICFSQTLHTPRSTKLDKLATHGADNFGISVDSLQGTRRLVWQQRRLHMTLDGIPRKDYADYLADAFPVVWLGNKDIALVSGSAEERRSYLDFLGTQWHPAYRHALREYRKALKSRNLLLRNPRHTAETLRSFARLLSIHGNVLRELRAQLLQLLRPHICHHHASISARQEEVTLRYMPCGDSPLETAFESSMEADIRAGFTTVGPHRDDFELHIAGRSAADFASEGQQRTLATAMLLAQAGLLQEQTGAAPILLIDDIFGELDPQRRRALLACLPSDSQVFITTTHTDWLHDTPPPLPTLKIENGRILQ
ncbi:MAG: DNA replication and repair protein RecF [Akkermansia sp.]|nr:DNA replication and repair protein RecF [Akkermansia sp.]MDO4750576.1 DNA replication and repair protein RecF [Akkermansia sp.]